MERVELLNGLPNDIQETEVRIKEIQRQLDSISL